MVLALALLPWKPPPPLGTLTAPRVVVSEWGWGLLLAELLLVPPAAVGEEDRVVMPEGGDSWWLWWGKCERELEEVVTLPTPILIGEAMAFLAPLAALGDLEARLTATPEPTPPPPDEVPDSLRSWWPPTPDPTPFELGCC